MEPMLTAAQAGIPVVDGDGMGRAFPEMQMCTWSIYGHKSTPAAMADEKGSIVIFRDTPTEVWLERLARATVVEMGAAGAIALAPMLDPLSKKLLFPIPSLKHFNWVELSLRASGEIPTRSARSWKKRVDNYS